MKKNKIKSWINDLRRVVFRFPLPLFFVIGLSLCFFITINSPRIQIKPSVWTLFSVGSIFTLALSVFLESYKSLIKRLFINFMLLLLFGIYIWILPNTFSKSIIVQQVVLGLSFLFSVFFVPFFKAKSDIPFWQFTKSTLLQIVISILFSAVLMAGLSIALISLRELFAFTINDKVFANLAVACFAVFAPIYFFATIPNKQIRYLQNYKLDNFLKVLGLYILFPLLLLYFIILYVYFIQIIIKWQLPDGWVSTLVSSLALGGLFCVAILYPLRLQFDRRVELFSRYFPLLITPLLILMSIGVFKRINDYGLSINRLYLLIFNAWLYGINIYLYLTKTKRLKWILISLSIVMVLSSVGPWNVSSITKRSILYRMDEVLVNSGLKIGEKKIQLISLIKLPLKKRKIVFEKIEYLYENFGNESVQNIFSDTLIDYNLWEIKEKIGLHFPDRTNFEFQMYPLNALIRVNQQFTGFILLSKSELSSSVLYSDNKFQIKLHGDVLILSKGGIKERVYLKLFFKPYILDGFGIKSLNINKLKVVTENFTLYIKSLSGQYTYKTDKFEIHRLEGLVFCK